ncbi:MAG: hypothetical protein J5526_04295 [Bacteroidales bacterium]|nr:hypothetical protein [Bacteroidales bacterium]
MELLNEPNKPMKGYFNSEARKKDNLAEVSNFDKTPVLEEDEIRLQNPWE